MEDAISSDPADMIDEVTDTIREAAEGQTVILIRIAIGKGVTVSRAKIASELHRRFPSASVDIAETAISDSIVVKDIEVE